MQNGTETAVVASCEWCHDPVNDEMFRDITRLLARFDGPVESYVVETWGKMPELLCAKDFILCYSQSLSATSTAESQI